MEKLDERWRTVGSDLSAAELVGARLVAGQREEANEPAIALLTAANATYRRLGERVLHGNDSRHLTAPTTVLSMEGIFYEKIRQSKARLAADARNPIAWSDLARRYTGLGQFDQARHALRVARLLAPDSRYLLRVTTRFLLHIDDADGAVRELRSSPRTMEDPWLLSALIAAATMSGQPLPGRRVAQRILDSGRFRKIETADLVSELGTLELSGGGDKRAKALMIQSLEEPTDNSLAQAFWVAPKLPTLEPRDEHITRVAFPAEARAWEASHRGDWDTALTQSVEWLADQPFDGDAATHASYVAAVGLDRWEDSLRLAKIGLMANPTHPTLMNNCAYALIEMGELDNGEKALRFAISNISEHSDRVAIIATAGLYQFRRGNPEGGRSFYRQAIELARRLRDRHAEATARSMLIREEAGGGTANLGVELAALDKAAKGLKEAGVLRCVERARDLAGIPLKPA
jgi:tetratricopeptide (TPR) repeat protein